MRIEDLQAVLRNSGIVGAGGAGFPSYAKLSKKADTLILNCAECEPLLKLHRQLLESSAEQIVSTLDLIAKTVEAKQVFIAIKKSYKKTISAVEKHLDFFKNIKIAKLPDVYPAGDEVVLTYEVTGRIVPAGAIPLEVGVTVFNVETMFNIHNALNDIPVTHKLVTIAGEVASPVTLLAPIGITAGELVELAGGETVENAEYLIGGPMMGKIGSRKTIITKTTNAILVLPSEHLLIKKRQTKVFIDMKRAMAACCQCSYCTSLCPRNLLGHPINPSEFMLAASNGITNNASAYVNSLYCSGCGLCQMFSCVQNLAPASLLSSCKAGLRENGVKPQVLDIQYKTKKERALRQVPMRRLLSRLGLVKYNVAAPINLKEVKPKKVTILLSQHIGAPAIPCVKVGDRVKLGDVIATAREGLSVAIHSSVSGTVKAVGEKAIIIETI